MDEVKVKTRKIRVKKVKKEPKQRKRLTPSSVSIARKDVEKFGGTEGCKGCEFYQGKIPKRRTRSR